MGKGEQTKALIVSRALALAHHVGLEGVSLGILATDLKLSKSGLFAHFASKEELQLEVVQELVDRFIAAIVAPAFARGRGEPRIRALFDKYLAWVHDHDGGQNGCVLTALMYEYAERDGRVRDKILASEREWFKTLSKSCAIAISEKHFKPDVDPDQFAYELLGVFSTYQHAVRFFKDPKAIARATHSFAALLDRCRN